MTKRRYWLILLMGGVAGCLLGGLLLHWAQAAGLSLLWLLVFLYLALGAFFFETQPLRKALRWRQEGKRERAAAALQRYVTRRLPWPALFRPSARQILGILQYELGNPEEAQAAVAPLREGRNPAKFRPYVHLVEALVALQQDDLAAARQHLERAGGAPAAPRLPLHGYRAWVAYLSDELEEAERLASLMATQVTYETPLAVTTLSAVSRLHGEYDRALAILEEVEHQIRAMSRRLVVAPGDRQLQEAVLALNRGFTYLELEEWDAAQEAFTAALQYAPLQPNHWAMAYAGLGVVYAAAGDEGEAAESFAEAESTLADLAGGKQARLFLGTSRAVAARLRGDWEEARQRLNEVLAQSPFPVWLPSLYYRLGEAHQALGQEAEAEKAYEAVIATGSSQIWVKRAEKRGAERTPTRLTEEVPETASLQRQR